MEWDQGIFFERLQKAIWDKGLNQTDVSERIGYTKSVLAQWSGKSHPRFDKVAKIAEILDISPGWLAFGIGSQRVPGPDEEQLLRIWDVLSPAQRAGVLQMLQGFSCPPPEAKILQIVAAAKDGVVK